VENSTEFDWFEETESLFKATFEALRDGRSPVPEDPEYESGFRQRFPGQHYFTSNEAAQLVQDFLDGKLTRQDCPEPMQDAIAAYNFPQYIRKVEAWGVGEEKILP
jgi:hypothetical protein